jgi:hypothetical protein
LPGDHASSPALDFRRLAASESLALVAAPAAAGLLTLLFVLPTLAPGVLFWDTAEFQTVGPVLGTAHPTGYPSYIILGWLASIVLQPFGDPAYRMNLLQAILAAAAIAGTTAIVQALTGRRMIALAIGLLLAWTQLFWRLSTHADPHMFHIALTAFLFVALLIWDQRRHSKDPVTLAHADRWLVAAAAIYGVAVANHSLALLLPPAIGLFVLAADWRVIFRWRTIVACLAVLAGTIAVLFAELPIRAAMNAPLVYGHPDTWSGFQYVVLAEQFRGSLQNPFGDLPTKAASVMDLMTGWLGPLGLLAALGVGTSIYRRPRYILLSGLALIVTCVFAASYANADIERYYLLPLMIAFTWIGLGAADIVAAIGWAVGEYERRYGLAAAKAGPDAGARGNGPAPETEAGAAADTGPGGADASPAASPAAPPRRDAGRAAWAVLVAEMAFAAALVVTSVGVISQRQGITAADNPGGVSEAQNNSDSVWMRQVLAPPDQGGLAQNAVIETTWSASTTLWYGQKVLGLRPDILIIDDSTRKNDHIGAAGEVWDVFDTYMATRPIYTDRFQGGCDGIQALGTAYNLEQTGLSQIYRVASRIQPSVTLPPCDPVKP